MIQLKPDKSYSIMLSGGLDSAVLLGLIVKSNPGLTLQPFTIPKHDGSADYIADLVKWANVTFEANVLDTIHVGDPDAHHRLQSTTAVKDIFEKYPHIDLIFNAINTNPPELADDPSAPQRDRRSTHPRIILPFAPITKDKILHIMYYHNLEAVVDLTHTCTAQKVGRCGVCWQCRERAWAFNKIGVPDTGTR